MQALMIMRFLLESKRVRMNRTLMKNVGSQ